MEKLNSLKGDLLQCIKNWTSIGQKYVGSNVSVSLLQSLIICLLFIISSPMMGYHAWYWPTHCGVIHMHIQISNFCEFQHYLIEQQDSDYLGQFPLPSSTCEGDWPLFREAIIPEHQYSQKSSHWSGKRFIHLYDFFPTMVKHAPLYWTSDWLTVVPFVCSV